MVNFLIWSTSKIYENKLINVVMNISQSFRKGRNTHLVPNEYLQIKTYRQTALGGAQLGRAQIK